MNLKNDLMKTELEKNQLQNQVQLSASQPEQYKQSSNPFTQGDSKQETEKLKDQNKALEDQIEALKQSLK